MTQYTEALTIPKLGRCTMGTQNMQTQNHWKDLESACGCLYKLVQTRANADLCKLVKTCKNVSTTRVSSWKQRSPVWMSVFWGSFMKESLF